MKQHLYRGFTLVELAAVLASVFTIMVVSSTLLYKMFETETTLERRSDDRAAQERLLDAFRADVRAFGEPKIVEEEAKTDAPAILLQWTTASGTVVYQMCREERKLTVVDRVVTEGSRPIARETFRLSDGVNVGVYRQSAGDDALVALSLWRATPEDAPIQKGDINPFTGEVVETVRQRTDPRWASNWRTAILRVPGTPSTETEANQ